MLERLVILQGTDIVITYEQKSAFDFGPESLDPPSQGF